MSVWFETVIMVATSVWFHLGLIVVGLGLMYRSSTRARDIPVRNSKLPTTQLCKEIDGRWYRDYHRDYATLEEDEYKLERLHLTHMVYFVIFLIIQVVFDVYAFVRLFR